MTRIILALASIALVFSIACGGDDKKDGGILGGNPGGSSSSKGGGDPKDPVAFAQRSIVTLFNMFGGSTDPQQYLDLYLPECRTGVKASDVTQVLTMIKAFFPDINKLKVEDVDLANPKVEKNGNDVKITITDSNKIRVKVNGKFVPAQEFFKSIGFDDPKDSPLEVTDEPLMLKEQDGKLYIANCDDLKDIASASSGPSATATPSRNNPTATPTRAAGSTSPTPGRGTTGAIGRDVTTPSRGGSTPTTANTPTTTGAVVKTTPTSAQQYPASLQKEFMDDCTGAGAGQSVCRCMLDILAVRYNEAAYRELEKAISNNQRQAELNAIVSACTR